MSGLDSLPDDVQQRLRVTAELAEQARQRLWAKNAHDPELLALLDLAVGNVLWLLAQVEILRAPDRLEQRENKLPHASGCALRFRVMGDPLTCTCTLDKVKGSK